MSLQKYVRCVVICKTYKTVFLKRPMFHLIFGAKISMKLEDRFCYSAVRFWSCYTKCLWKFIGKWWPCYGALLLTVDIKKWIWMNSFTSYLFNEPVFDCTLVCNQKLFIVQVLRNVFESPFIQNRCLLLGVFWVLIGLSFESKKSQKG